MAHVANPSFVQSKAVSAVAATSLTVTLDNAPVRGNSIIFILLNNHDTGDIGTSTAPNGAINIGVMSSGTTNANKPRGSVYFLPSVKNARQTFTFYWANSRNVILLAMEYADCIVVLPNEQARKDTATTTYTSELSRVTSRSNMTLMGITIWGNSGGTQPTVGIDGADFTSRATATLTNGSTNHYGILVADRVMTVRKTDATFSGTHNQNEFSTTVSYELWKTGRQINMGGEEGSGSSNAWNSVTGTFSVDAARTGSDGSGSVAMSRAGTSGIMQALQQIPVYMSDYQAQLYYCVATEPTADCEIMRFGSTGSMRLIWVQASDKVKLSAYRSDGVESTSALLADTNTAGDWHKVNIRVTYETDGTCNIDWYHDDVAQTSLTVAESTSNRTWNMDAVNHIAFGNPVSIANARVRIDDLILIGDPRYLKWPMAAQSVLSYSPNGQGTDVNPTNFVQSDAGAIGANSYQFIDQSIGLTTPYIEQSTASETSYLEFTMEDMNARAGGGTLYMGLTKASGLPDEISLRMLVGSEEWDCSSEDMAIAANIGATNIGSTRTISTMWGTDPKTPTNTGRYLDADWDASKIRVGYGTLVNSRIAAVILEIAALEDDALGSDAWGWSDSDSDSWG
jgi:hypothetical protein